MSRDEENIDEPDQNDPGFEAAEAAGPGRQQRATPPQQPDDAADAEDILFEAPTDDAECSEEFGARQQFSEGSKAKWGGHAMSADEIGIPVDQQQPGYMSEEEFELDSDQELQLVDDESQLEVEAADAPAEDAIELEHDEDLVLDEGPMAHAADEEQPEAGAGESLEGEFFVLDEAEQNDTLLEPKPADSYPVEEGWEPVGAEGEGGEPWLEPEPTPAPVSAVDEDLDLQPAHAGFEEYAVDAGPSVIAAAPPRRARALRMLSSLAAAVIVVGAGAVVVLRPEWLGLHFEPQLVERVQVARPSLDTRVAPPPPPLASSTPKPVTPDVTPPTPAPTNDPPSGTPTIEPPPPTPDEPQPEQPTDPLGAATPPQAGRDLPHYLPVGESLWIGDYDKRERKSADWAAVQLGAKAFAQLHNGNYFVGSVKAVAAEELILRVQDGEVTLMREEVQTVTTLDSDEYAELQRATTGFLRLSNRNRLVGTILKSVVDDNYVLQMRSDRIVVPRSAVEQVVSQPGTDNIRFGSARDEEEWLRTVAERKLQAMTTESPAAPSAETTPRRGTTTLPKLPLKQVGKKPPSDGATKAPVKAAPKAKGK